MMGKLAYFFPAVASRMLMSKLTSSVECVFTNVRGPDMQLHLLGRKITSFMGFVPPPPGVGLGVAVGSFFGKLNFSVSVDKTLMGDASQALARFYDEELTTLLEVK